jgi:hypothetical protein
MASWQQKYPQPHWAIIRHVVSIAGTVRDAATGAPIAGALVELAEGPRQGRQSSQPDGSYFFVDLPKGSYRLRVSVPGLAGRYQAYASEPIEIGDAGDAKFAPATQNILLAPTRVHGSVQGALSDGTLAPIAGAVVRLRGDRNGVVTDEKGQYALNGIRAGSQTVEATAARFRLKAEPLTLEVGEDHTLDLTLDPEPTAKKPNGTAGL